MRPSYSWDVRCGDGGYNYRDTTPFDTLLDYRNTAGMYVYRLSLSHRTNEYRSPSEEFYTVIVSGANGLNLQIGTAARFLQNNGRTTHYSTQTLTAKYDGRPIGPTALALPQETWQTVPLHERALPLGGALGWWPNHAFSSNRSYSMGGGFYPLPTWVWDSPEVKDVWWASIEVADLPKGTRLMRKRHRYRVRGPICGNQRDMGNNPRDEWEVGLKEVSHILTVVRAADGAMIAQWIKE